MPKVKIPRKSTSIDMTAMCDVAFLLLTFFILTSKFKPNEPVAVDIPSSISQIKLPETDVMLITLDRNGRVFFDMDGQEHRKNLLAKMGERYKINFTDMEFKQFSLASSVGMPVAQLQGWLALSPNERNSPTIKYPGIPCDTSSTLEGNELADWVLFARQTNPRLRIAIKGDREANYPGLQKVVATLQNRKVNKFNFITALEGAPTAAASVE